MLLVHVDEFHLILGQLFFVLRLEYKDDVVGAINRPQGDCVFGAGTSQDLGHPEKWAKVQHVTIFTRHWQTSPSPVYYNLFAGSKNLRSDVHAHGKVPVASVLVEAVAPEVQRHEGDVGIVHGLNLDARIRAFEGRLGQEVLYGLQDLLQDRALSQSCLEHGLFCCVERFSRCETESHRDE